MEAGGSQVLSGQPGIHEIKTTSPLLPQEKWHRVGLESKKRGRLDRQQMNGDLIHDCSSPPPRQGLTIQSITYLLTIELRDPPPALVPLVLGRLQAELINFEFYSYLPTST